MIGDERSRKRPPRRVCRKRGSGGFGFQEKPPCSIRSWSLRDSRDFRTNGGISPSATNGRRLRKYGGDFARRSESEVRRRFEKKPNNKKPRDTAVSVRQFLFGAFSVSDGHFRMADDLSRSLYPFSNSSTTVPSVPGTRATASWKAGSSGCPTDSNEFTQTDSSVHESGERRFYALVQGGRTLRFRGSGKEPFQIVEARQEFGDEFFGNVIGHFHALPFRSGDEVFIIRLRAGERVFELGDFGGEIVEIRGERGAVVRFRKFFFRCGFEFVFDILEVLTWSVFRNG